MPLNLSYMILFVSFSLFLILFLLFFRDKMPLKYLLIWLFPTTVILFIAIFPDFLWGITRLMGFQTISNMVIGVFLVFIFFICIVLTIICSGQKVKITQLIQEVSILKEQVEEIEKNK